MINASFRPRALPVQVEYIPTVLKVRLQWVGWHYALRAGKWTKIPMNPSTGGNAKINDPGTWGTFVEALECYHGCGLDGIGFVFASDDPYCGVDLDKCRDPATGLIEPWADTIIREVDSYSEVSPSGTGVKLFMRASLPPGGNRCGQIELYDRARYFTLTGHHLPNTPRTIEARQAAIDALHSRLFTAHRRAPASFANRPQSPLTSDDDEILRRAFSARNGNRFARLWAGDVSGYDSHSEADAALCTTLAFWCGPDTERIDRLFQRSGLYRDKWERADYREATIDLAIRRSASWMPTYSPRRNVGRGLVHGWNAQTRRHRAVVLGA